MKKLSIFVAIALAVVSCKENENTADVVKPTIQWFTPMADQEVEPGKSFELKAIATDDKELGSYKIEVHSAADGHHHRSVLSKSHFTYEHEAGLSGKTQEILHKINVPETVEEGHYHVGLFVLDKAGNQTQKFVEIFIGDHHNHAH